MNSKKGLLYLFVFSLIFTFSVNFVSASEFTDALAPVAEAVSGIFETIFETIRPFLAILLGEAGESYDSGSFMGKIIGLIVVTSIIYVVLSKSMSSFFDNHKWALWIISLAIPILGFRFVDASIIDSMVLPSSVFAVAVTSGLPFVLYFYLIEGFPSYIKKIAWIFFAAIFIVLYFVRFDELSTTASSFYIVTALLALFMMYLDGTLRKFFFGMKIQKAREGIYGHRIAVYEKAISDIDVIFNNKVSTGTIGTYIGSTPGNIGNTGEPAYRKDVDYYTRQIHKLIGRK